MPEGTRDRIVEATVRVIADKGYADATVKDIAAEARVAAGLLHYYFKSKEELVVAALTLACRRLRPELTGDPGAFARDVFERLRVDAGSPYRRLYVEMFGLAMHNESIRAALLPFVREDRRYAEEVTRAVLAQREERPLAAAPALAAAVYGGVMGIFLQQLLDPEFDADAAMGALAELALRD